MYKLFNTSLAVLMMTAVSCQQQPSDKYIITGSIANADGQPIYFHRYEKESIISDTATISNGKFVFEGTIAPIGGRGFVEYGKPSSPYAGDNRIEFFFSPGETTINVGNNPITEASVSGSQLQKQYEDYEKSIPTFTEEFDALRDSVKLYPENKSKYYAQHDSLYNIIKRKRIDFIKSNPESFVAYYELSNFRFCDNIPLDELDLIYENLSPEIKEYDKVVKPSIDARHSIEPGMPAPELKGVDPTRNTEVKLTDLKGKYVLIDFWATWCHGCVLGLPHVRSIYEKYNPFGLEVVALSKDHNINSWKNFIEKNEYMKSFYNLLSLKDISVDNEGNFTNDSLENRQDSQYNISFIPQTFLVDKEGKIIGRFNDTEELDAKLVEIFGK